MKTRTFIAVLAGVALGLAPAVSLASSMTTTGAGKPASAASTPVSFVAAAVGESTVAGSGQTIAFPTGAGLLSGDLLIIFINNGSSGLTATPTVTGSGRSLTQGVLNALIGAGPYRVSIYYIALNSSDISTGTWTTSTGYGANSPVQMAIYRGVTSIGTPQTASGAVNGSTLAFSSYTPAGNTGGAVAFMSDSASQAAPTAQATWTFDVSNVTRAANTFFRHSVADNIPSYAGGAVTFTGFGASGGEPFGAEVELLK